MKKIVSILLLLLFFQTSIHSVELEDLNMPKSPANRLGVSDKPENKVEIKKITNNKDKKQSGTKKTSQTKEIGAYNKTYADISLKKIALDISDELSEEESVIYADLSTLWIAAAKNSETIQYAIFKLSNPDENKPDESTLKKIIRPVASLSSIAGTAFAGNPFLASGAMIGGGLLGAISSDDKDTNYRFTKVNDANMVLLVQKIENLQKRLLDLYIDYKTKQHVYEMAFENVQKREKIFQNMQDKSKEEIILADVYLRNSQNFMEKAKSDYLVSKNVLEQLVGANAVKELED